jgi:hypothetical protein
MADKKLEITADLKLRTRDMERSLKTLEKQVNGISKTLKGLDLSTAGGRAGFAKSIATSSKEMLKFKGTTTDTAKAMEQLWGRQINQYSRNVERYTRLLDGLHKKRREHEFMRNYAQSTGATDSAKYHGGEATSLLDRIAVAEGGRRANQSKLDELKPGGDSKLSAFGAMLVAVIGSAVTRGLSQGIDIYQNSKTAGLGHMAAATSVGGGMMSRIAGGDYMDAAFLMRNNGAGLKYLRESAGTMAGSAKSGISNSGGALNPFGVVDAVGNAYDYSVEGGKYSEEAHRLNTNLDNGRRLDPYLAMRFNAMTASASMRRDASLRLGGHHQMIAGMGAGAGLSQGESFGTAMSMAENFGGGSAVRNFGAQMYAQRRGFNRDLAGSVVGNLDAASGGKGLEQFKAILAAGTKAGLESVNIQFFEKFAQAVASQSFGKNGAISGGNYANALMFGIGKNSSMADVQGNISGAQALSNLVSGGSNPFFNAVGLEMSKNILGGGASGVKMQAMNSASLADLMSGKNEELDALGISKDQRQRLLNGKLDAVTRSFLGEDTDEGQYLLGGASRAGGMKQFLATDKHGRQLMASVLKATMPEQFQDYKSALGATNVMAGIDSTGGGGALPGVGDGMAITHLQTQSKIMQQIWKDEAEVREKMLGAMKLSMENFKELKDNPVGYEAGEKVVEILDRVYKAFKQFEGLDDAVGKLEAKAKLIREGRVTATNGQQTRTGLTAGEKM